MSIKFSEAELRNPQRLEEPPLVYARAQAREVISIQRLAEEIAWGTSMTSGDVVGVIRGVASRIPAHLKDGDSVNLTGLGIFQCQISSRGAESIEGFTHNNIKSVRIQFRPGKTLENAIANVRFESVLSLKAKQEAKRKEREENQP